MKKKIKILILEDNPTDAELIKHECTELNLGVKFQKVDTKELFLDSIKSFNPDIILSDYSLPQFDGMSALRLAKKHAPSIPFIIVTGAINEETAVECMKAGAADYVLKDRLSRLVPSIKGALDKSRAMQEKKKAEDALVASEMRYRRLFESAKEGIVLMDAGSSQITDVNPFMLNLMLAERKEVLGKPIWEIGLMKEQGTLQDAFEAMKKDEYLHCEDIYIQPYPDIQIDLELTCNIYSIDSKKLIQCNLRDITERRQGEDEKEKIRAQLFQAQKMEAIGTLAGGVAHDFNNLMTAVQVSTDVAMMKVDETNLIYRELKEIRFAAMRAAGLIRQLLLFSRKQLMEFQLLNINMTIENLIKMLQRLIGENIAIQTEFDDDIWSIQADPGNVEQVIMNLSLNARDAMPQGGKLLFRTANEVIDKAFCKIKPDARPGDFVCLTVEDNGEGIPPDTISRIFEPFFTSKGPGEGTGLGLSVVYGIVKQHGGWIDVKSETGKGTVFNVYFPGSGEQEEVKEEEKESIKKLKGNGQRILLVEDEEKVRESTQKAMDRCGYQVFAASCASEALTLFKKKKGDFDLVFSDVVLSDRSGIELADDLLSLKKDLHILLSSGYTDHKSQWPLIREKGLRFLQKPYTLSELLKAIQEAL